MALPGTTGVFDKTKSSYVPTNSGTWADLSSWTTWTNWSNRPAGYFLVVSDISDRGRIGYFNLKTSADVSGSIAYTVYTSSTGAFAGEETVTTISPNTGNLTAFYGRYYAISANVSGGTGTELRNLTITSTNDAFDIDYNDINTNDLDVSPNASGGHILTLPRVISAVVNMQVTPSIPISATSNYITTGNTGYVLDFTATASTTLSTSISNATMFTAYAAVATTASPSVLIYKTIDSGTTYSLIGNVANGVSSYGESISWNSSGTQLILGTDAANAPYNLRVYQRSIDTVTKGSDPDIWPAGVVRDLAWTRASDDAFVVAHSSSPYISVYAGSTVTKRSDPATLPTGGAYCVAWTPDDAFLAVGHDNSPYLSVYSKSGATLTKIADPASVPASAVVDLAWNATGNILVCTTGLGSNATLKIYTRSGSTLTAASAPATIPVLDASGVFSLDFNTSGNAMAIGWSSNRTDATTSKRFGIYRVSGSTFTWTNTPTSLDVPVYDIRWGGNGSQLYVAYHDSTVASNPGLDVYNFDFTTNTVSATTGIGAQFAGNAYAVNTYLSSINNYLEVANAAPFTGGGNIRVRNETMNFTTANTTAFPNRLEGLSRAYTTTQFGTSTANSHAAGSEVSLISSISNALYFEQTATTTSAIAFIGSKDRTQPVVVIKDSNNAIIDCVFDARLKVLPEQYMDKTNLGVR
jgi:hypothetical protein